MRHSQDHSKPDQCPIRHIQTCQALVTLEAVIVRNLLHRPKMLLLASGWATTVKIIWPRRRYDTSVSASTQCSLNRTTNNSQLPNNTKINNFKISNNSRWSITRVMRWMMKVRSKSPSILKCLCNGMTSLIWVKRSLLKCHSLAWKSQLSCQWLSHSSNQSHQLKCGRMDSLWKCLVDMRK